MREILKRKEDWTRKEISKAEAMDLFRDQKYKTEIIKDLPESETISIYYTGDDYVDLCRGPHVDNSAELLQAAFKVKAVSAAYWRGDAKNDSMQRIYIYAFPSKDELKKHLAFVKEAEERDHKKLGPELQLSCFMKQNRVCLTGFPGDGECIGLWWNTGEISTTGTDIRRYQRR